MPNETHELPGTVLNPYFRQVPVFALKQLFQVATRKFQAMLQRVLHGVTTGEEFLVHRCLSSTPFSDVSTLLHIVELIHNLYIFLHFEFLSTLIW
jgi:hypothetical protein